MVLRWSAHLALLFTEYPLLDRFEACHEAGFTRAECWSLASEDPAEVVQRVRQANVELVAFNLNAGDMAAGERGFLNVRSHRDAVLTDAARALDLANTLGVGMINALVGNAVSEDREAELDETIGTLRRLARLAEGTGICLLVEALNAVENPRYLVHSIAQAARVVAEVDHPQVAVMLDAYHVARDGGDPLRDFQEWRDVIRHIQVADVPDRHEPGSGDLDYQAFFKGVYDAGYTGAIGLEYRPVGGTLESLRWLPRDARSVGAPDLRRAQS